MSTSKAQRFGLSLVLAAVLFAAWLVFLPAMGQTSVNVVAAPAEINAAAQTPTMTLSGPVTWPVGRGTNYTVSVAGLNTPTDTVEIGVRGLFVLGWGTDNGKLTPQANGSLLWENAVSGTTWVSATRYITGSFPFSATLHVGTVNQTQIIFTGWGLEEPPLPEWGIGTIDCPETATLLGRSIECQIVVTDTYDLTGEYVLVETPAGVKITAFNISTGTGKIVNLTLGGQWLEWRANDGLGFKNATAVVTVTSQVTGLQEVSLSSVLRGAIFRLDSVSTTWELGADVGADWFYTDLDPVWGCLWPGQQNAESWICLGNNGPDIAKAIWSESKWAPELGMSNVRTEWGDLPGRSWTCRKYAGPKVSLQAVPGQWYTGTVVVGSSIADPNMNSVTVRLPRPGVNPQLHWTPSNTMTVGLKACQVISTYLPLAFRNYEQPNPGLGIGVERLVERQLARVVITNTGNITLAHMSISNYHEAWECRWSEELAPGANHVCEFTPSGQFDWVQFFTRGYWTDAGQEKIVMADTAADVLPMIKFEASSIYLGQTSHMTLTNNTRGPLNIMVEQATDPDGVWSPWRQETVSAQSRVYRDWTPTQEGWYGFRPAIGDEYWPETWMHVYPDPGPCVPPRICP